MDSVLFVCKTPFQIITAIILKVSKYQDNECDLILIPEFQGIDEIRSKLSTLNIFSKVIVQDIVKTNKALYIKYNFFPKSAMSSVFGEGWNYLSSRNYTKLITNGSSSDFDNALYCALKYPEPIFYDEGYSTYTDQFLHANNRISKSHKIIRKISMIVTGRKLLFLNVKKIYLYNPLLMVKDMPFICEKIWEKEKLEIVMQYVNYIFASESVASEYAKPYIFFEECFANDFNNNGDMKIIKYICDCVGKDKITIKLHPRDKTNRFKKLGISVNETLSTPAEALVPMLKDSNKTFITFSSGSVMNHKFICDFNIKSILLYKLMPKDFVQMPEDRLQWFEKFLTMYGDSIFAPTSFEELNSLLKENENIE